MIYDHFAIGLPDGDEWVEVGVGVLAGYHVESVDNPTPEPKYDYLDISGASGEIDLTESNGRVFFKNKTVKVVIGAQTTPESIQNVQDALSGFNGRSVQFTFNDVPEIDNNFRYQVGRVTIDYDLKEHHITFTFEGVEPFRYAYREYRLLQNFTALESSGTWSTGQFFGGELVYGRDNEYSGGFCSFVYSTDKPMVQFIRYKAESGTHYHALGIKNIVGGKIEFLNAAGEYSQTYSKTYDGKIQMRITVDGSYYEWRTLNGTRQYIPTIRCTYMLSSDLPVSGGAIADSVRTLFDSNVVIRPLVSNTSVPAYIICDGVCAESSVGVDGYVPRLVMPSDYADFSNDTVESICLAIPKTAGQTPQVRLIYSKAEVF